jgi:hypothetical protein
MPTAVADNAREIRSLRALTDAVNPAQPPELYPRADKTRYERIAFS